MLQGRSRYFVVPASRMPATFSFPCAINLNNRPRANLYRSPFGNSAITISPFSLDSSKSTRMPSFANLAITVFISLSKGPSQMGLNCRRKWGGAKPRLLSGDQKAQTLLFGHATCLYPQVRQLDQRRGPRRRDSLCREHRRPRHDNADFCVRLRTIPAPFTRYVL